MKKFEETSDYDLAYYLGQFCRVNAGWYRGFRRQNLRAEREAARRGPLPVVFAPRRWWHFTRATVAAESRRRDYFRRQGNWDKYFKTAK